MKYCKKLSLEKLVNQNEKISIKNDNNDGFILHNHHKKHQNKKFTTFITITTNSTSTTTGMGGYISTNENLMKCHISGRDNCFWCTRSLLKIDEYHYQQHNHNNNGITNYEIVDPDDFFEEEKEKEEENFNQEENNKETKLCIISIEEKKKNSICSHNENLENYHSNKKCDQEEEQQQQLQQYEQGNDIFDLSPDWEIIQTPVDLNQNFFSSEFEDEIVATMSSRPTSPLSTTYYDIIDTTSDTDYCCHYIFRITFCELFFCFRQRIINGVPEKSISSLSTLSNSSPSSVFEIPSNNHYYYHHQYNQSSSSTLPSSPILSTCKIKKSLNNRRNKLYRSLSEEKEYRKNSKADAFSRSIMGAISKCHDCDNSNNSDNDDIISSTTRIFDNNQYQYCDPFDIQEYFKIDDHGNILIDISHIIEEKGHGFLMRRTKKLYRSVKCGIAINESYTVKKCLYEKLQEFLHFLKEIIFGKNFFFFVISKIF